jgi:hypothetical protein
MNKPTHGHTHIITKIIVTVTVNRTRSDNPTRATSIHTAATSLAEADFNKCSTHGVQSHNNLTPLADSRHPIGAMAGKGERREAA